MPIVFEETLKEKAKKKVTSNPPFGFCLNKKKNKTKKDRQKATQQGDKEKYNWVLQSSSSDGWELFIYLSF